MLKKYRRPIIAGNWKMNMLPSEVSPYLDRLSAALPAERGCDVILCPPYPLLPAAAAGAGKCGISVGAQNVSEHGCGAYTGEVSLAMLADLGAEYVILGHSERRALYGETDGTVRAKLACVLAGGLRPILCVGENETERDGGLTTARIAAQLNAALCGVGAEEIIQVIIAYEPVWAIGTGKTAAPEDAQAVCAAIRGELHSLYGEAAARAVRILYGGSMNEKNAASLLAMRDIDGGLIGGASLDAERFAAIAAAVQTENETESGVSHA